MKTLQDALITAAIGKLAVLFVGENKDAVGKQLIQLQKAMPPMTHIEVQVTTGIYALMGLLLDDHWVWKRPLRFPNPTNITKDALVGTLDIMGEQILATNGILYLDDFAAYSDDAIAELFEQYREEKDDRPHLIQRLQPHGNYILVARTANPPEDAEELFDLIVEIPKNLEEPYPLDYMEKVLEKVGINWEKAWTVEEAKEAYEKAK